MTLKEKYLLSADVGGTNSRMQIFSVDESLESIKGQPAPGTLVKSSHYMNMDFSSFSAIVREFLNDASLSDSPVAACFAIAGPVNNNSAELTNRAWPRIDGNKMAIEFGIRKVVIVNDFIAVGYGLLTLDVDQDCAVLNKAGGERNHSGPIACIGAGTGLGECYLTPCRAGDYTCFASEGGHAEFSPRNKEQESLLHFLKQKFRQPNRVSMERLVSGPGIVSIYEFLSSKHPTEVNKAVKAKIDSSDDLQAAVIAINQDACSICKRSMGIFFETYGVEAGVAALKWMPTGGLFLCGGMTVKNLETISDENGAFLKAFVDKGRLSGVVKSVPVYAVLVEELGERGAHWEAFNQFKLITKGKSEEASTSGVLGVSSLTVPVALGLGVCMGIAAAGIANLMKR